MKNRNFMEIMKNAAGTVFLLAAAFFVCSTFLSMRAVFADPVAPVSAVAASPQASRAGVQQNARTNRTSPRGDASATASRGTTAASRNVADRATVSRAQPSNVNTARNVKSRSTQNRAVIARTATNANQARVSLQGNAIRGSKTVNTNQYTYLTNKLYTGNYSNIIDSQTGLISAEAYSNCMESYYTCMDEICTVRNAAQRRCACAGRVRAFADAEAKLESANEELIKVSGELALLIATKGKDVSSAFTLTEAEKVMNCVSYQDAKEVATTSNTREEDMVAWCQNHMMYDTGKCSYSVQPSYCSPSGNNFGFDVSKLDGSGSDIAALFKSWADAKDKTMTITLDNDYGLTMAVKNLSNIVGGLTGGEFALNDDGTLQDSLAETWGYELFEYAHNNVCNRVLDSCFNGIYEACGAPPSSGRKCSNGSGSCPYNYNSQISVVKNNTGEYALNFVTPNSGYTASNSATCFGYASTSGDPYSNLRGPVADSRRSILQKYALDANADCDAYGDQLRTTAQNIGYQKVAAQQALQKKRLEFAQEEERTTLADATTASTNFSQCISEIYECYTTQDDANTGRSAKWTTSRIKTYCATVANVPSCYAEMMCNPSSNQFKAVVDVADSTSCDSTLAASTSSKQACRNVVVLNEILNGTGTTAAGTLGANVNSAALREQCIQDALGKDPTTGAVAIRTWKAAGE